MDGWGRRRRGSGFGVGGRELPDEPDLGHQPLPELRLHLRLGERDQRPHVRGGGAAEVHDDVGVQVGDLGAANAVALETALVHQAPGADALDLPEDRARAGVDREPGMPRAAPAEVLLVDAEQLLGVGALEAEGGGEDVIGAVVEDAVVVAEPDVLRIDGPPLASSM